MAGSEPHKNLPREGAPMDNANRKIQTRLSGVLFEAVHDLSVTKAAIDFGYDRRAKIPLGLLDFLKSLEPIITQTRPKVVTIRSCIHNSPGDLEYQISVLVNLFEPFTRLYQEAKKIPPTNSEEEDRILRMILLRLNRLNRRKVYLLDQRYKHDEFDEHENG